MQRSLELAFPLRRRSALSDNQARTRRCPLLWLGGAGCRLYRRRRVHRRSNGYTSNVGTSVARSPTSRGQAPARSVPCSSVTVWCSSGVVGAGLRDRVVRLRRPRSPTCCGAPTSKASSASAANPATRGRFLTHTAAFCSRRSGSRLLRKEKLDAHRWADPTADAPPTRRAHGHGP